MSDYLRYDSVEINKIADEISIKDYLSSKGLEPDKKVGTNLYFHCCNNSDSDASLCVDTVNNRYHCFSCGSGTNVLSYMVNEEHLSFPEACQKIIRLSGVDIKKGITPSSMVFFNKIKRAKIKSDNSDINHVAKDYSDYLQYPRCYPQEWLSEGITKEAMDVFDIRYDAKCNRILYPLYSFEDKQYKYLGMKGRTRFKDHKVLGIPKYLSLQKIGQINFFGGLKENESNIKQQEEIILVEGIKSVMKLWGWNIRNAVSCGTANLNKGQIQTLLELDTKTVVVAFDKDKTYKDVTSHLGILPKFVNVYVMIDKENLLDKKMSPCDVSLDVWNKLYDNKIKVK